MWSSTCNSAHVLTAWCFFKYRIRLHVALLKHRDKLRLFLHIPVCIKRSIGDDLIRYRQFKNPFSCRWQDPLIGDPTIATSPQSQDKKKSLAAF